ncbi:MAG: T9SS type A sorting domain-containing protein [Ferruginibacter sp.]|nr:T9SS type A sorting domain-containing protein [Chitinophagaceae bacterium]
MKVFSLVLQLFFFLCIDSKAAIRYITPSGAGSMNGTTWASAFPGSSLQLAISSSLPGDEVWVMTGSYFTTATNNRNIYFSMQNGVAVYGSFNGTETNLSQRSFSCGFTSILSAEIGVPGNADNSYHVISNSSVNNTAVLDGFIIRDGRADFDLTGNDNRSLGGGMINVGSNGGLASPTIRNCLFTNNTALFGGGIFNHGQNAGNASPVISNCIFMLNTATGGGGGIDNFGYNGTASPVITNSIFYMNTATDRAGAMYCWGGGNGNASPAILNCVFINNSSFDGGGIVADRSNFGAGNSGIANPTIRNSIFWGNTASGTGPQFFLIGGAGFAATYSAIDISNQNIPHTITGPGNGNITISPSFINIADPRGTDNCWLTSDDGLQLQSSSAGLDAGDNTGVSVFDIRNYNRVANGIVDMGAYEFNSTALPVHLFNFSGRSGGNANFIFWSTSSEHHNYFFEVLRSDDAVHFEKIGEIPGSGNSGVLKQYQFTDDRLINQQYYYRLKQIDRDGRNSFSNIILLTNRSSKQDILVFPNPVVNIATLLFQEGIVNQEFVLFNSSGQLVDKLVIHGRTGQIDLTGRPAGLYVLINQKLGIEIKIQKVTGNQ